jgi:spoIIIJ-associated protein
MEQDNKEKLKSIVSEIVGKMGFSAEVEVKEMPKNSIFMKDSNEIESQESFICNILSDENSSFLIGQQGNNLQALQHIVRLAVKNKIKEKINCLVDVNAYRIERAAYIKNMAEEAAKEALAEKRAIIMKPMTAFERRIVHMVLGANEEVATESIGEDENRKVVVRPVEMV